MTHSPRACWRVETGATVRALPGEPCSGDAVFTWSDGNRGLFAVVDGLGHGAPAEASARRAVETLRRHAGAPLAELFVQVYAALEGRRGVVMSVVHVELLHVSFAGVGNVELVGPPETSRPPCMPGVLGSGRLLLRPAALPVAPGVRWGLVSDGIRQRELRSAWRAAAPQNPSDAAGTVLALAARDDDDASVLVLDFHPGAA